MITTTVSMPKARTRGETKSSRSFSLTATAQESLNKMALERGISASELIEQFARGEISSDGETCLESSENDVDSEVDKRLAALEEKVNALLTVIESAIIQKQKES